MRKIYLLFLMFVGSFLSLQAQIYVASSGGSSTTATYSTLDAAFTAINGGSLHTGTIDIRINSNVTQTVTARLTNAGSYSSISIRPADSATVEKVITGSINGFPIIKLTGNSANVTIDGRAGGTGSTRRLKISNTNVNTASHTIQLDSGANNHAVKWSTLTNATSSNGGQVVLFSSGPAVSNISFSNNIQTGGNRSVDLTATAGTPATNITFSKSQFQDAFGRTLSITSGVSSITFDSNQVFHSSGFNSTAAVTGIFTSNDVANCTVNFTRNHMYNLKTTSTQLIGVFMSVTGTNSGMTYNINNNFISFAAAIDSGVTLMEGLRFQTVGRCSVNVYHNTVKLGGTMRNALGTAFSEASACILKSNSNSSSIFDCRNNICQNERTGGVTNVLHLAGFYTTPTTGTNSINYNYYKTTNNTFVNVWIGSIYTTYTGSYASAAGSQEQNSLFGTGISYTGGDNLHLTGVSIQSSDLIGTPVSISNDIDNDSRSSSFPYKGADESTAFYTNDATVQTVYTMGRMPVGQGNPHIISASVKNVGVATITSLKVYLNVSGANSFTDSVTISSLASFATVNVDFNQNSYTNIGTNTVTVSVAADQNTSNDSKVATLKTTANSYNYGDFALAPTGGVGFTGGTGDFVAKFNVKDSVYINQISVFFNTGNDSVQIGIWDMNSSTKRPNNNLWTSAKFKAPAGPVLQVISVPNILVNGGAFFCGVRQVNTTNIGFAYQTESPIRDSSFYFTSPTGGTTWNDFFSSSSPYKFMIEPRYQLADDIGGISMVSPSSCTHGTNQTVTFTIQNLGYDTVDFAANNVTVKSSCTLPNNTVSNFGDVVISTGTLLPGATQNVTVSTTFNMSTDGAYKFRAWTAYGLDINDINDTVPQVTINVVSPVSVPYTQDFNSGVSTPTGWTVAGGFAVTAAAGSGSTNGLRVNNWTGNLTGTVTLPKVGPTTSTTAVQFEYKITDFTGGGATTLTAQDSIKIQVSNDCGASFTTISTIHQSNHSASTSFATKLVDLSAYSGQKIIIRLISQTTGSTTNDYNVDLDNFNVFNQAPMAYVSSNAVQTNFGNVAVNSSDNEVIGLQIVTSGNTSPLSVSFVRFNTQGTTNTADLANAKLFYTGSNGTFSVSTQVGSTVSNPSGFFSFTLGSPVTLGTGNNYFWLSYSSTSSATVGNKVDAYVDYATISGINKYPSPKTISGDRMIFYCSPANTVACGTSYIDGIQFGTINNTSSGCSNTHGNAWTNYFTSNSASVTTNLRANNVYTFTYTNSVSAQIASMWIDYDRNGVYDASEWTQIGTSIPGNSTVTFDVAIPSNVTPGIAGMRIRSRLTGSSNGSGDACTTFGSGETEDYKVVLQAPCDWTGGTSTDWNNTANWACNCLPTGIDNVKIPTGTTFSPTVNTAASSRDVLIMSGATVNFNAGSSLTVNKTLTVSGTLNHTAGKLILNTPQYLASQQYFFLSLNGSGTYTMLGDITTNNYLIVGSGTTLDMSGFICDNKRDINNAGTVSGAGKFTLTTTGSYQTIMGGGSFSNLELNTSTTSGVRLTQSCAITDTLWLTQGQFVLNPSVTLTSGSTSNAIGNIITTGGSILGGSSAASSSVVINGSAGASQITNFKMSSPGNLTVDRPAGLSLGGTLSVGSALTLNACRLEMNGYNLISGNTGTSNGNITGTGAWRVNNGGATGTLSILGNASAATLSSLKLDSMQNITINRIAGITIANNFLVKGIANIQKGYIDLSGMIVTLGASASVAELPGNTFKGSSGYLQTTRSYGSAITNLNVGGMGLILTTNNAPGSTYMQRGHQAYTSMSGQGIKRWFNYNPANYSGLITTVNFIYDSTELNGAVYSRLRVNQSNDNGSSWSTLAGGSRSTSATANGYVIRGGVSVPSGGSYLTVSDSTSSPLSPVYTNQGKPGRTYYKTNNLAVNNKIALYPNPFANEFTVDMNVAAGTYTLQLIDMSGKTVYSQILETTEGNTKLIVSSEQLPYGVYMLNVVSNSGVQTIRVIKQ